MRSILRAPRAAFRWVRRQRALDIFVALMALALTVFVIYLGLSFAADRKTDEQRIVRLQDRIDQEVAKNNRLESDARRADCFDTKESRWELALSDAVLASSALPEGESLDPKGPELTELNVATEDLRNVEKLCPPVVVPSD